LRVSTATTTRASAAVVAVAAACALAGLLPAGAQAVPPQLAHACTPNPTSCNGWYRGPVRLAWDWDQLNAHPSGGNCSEQWFTADTPGRVVRCEVTNNALPNESHGYSVTIRLDQTPPAVTAATERPPDYNGWFNHPVSLTFRGSDATSGVAGCSSAVYAGPDGAGARVAGTCQDVAGNVGSGFASLNYDATPPPTPFVDSLPGDNRIALEWSTSPDSQAEVVRFAPDTPPVAVFRGPGGSFTDRSLRNGRRYRYAVSLIDQAGNRAVGTTSAVPTSSKLLEPAKGERIRLVQLPLLIWKRVRKADYYNVQIYRGKRKVLSSWPRRPRFQVKRRWRFGGKQYRLVPGKYCWYVWPGHGERSKRDYGKRLGKSCFRIVR
jgi:hypothetical protein